MRSIPITVTSVWVIYEVVVLIWTEFLSRTLKLWEKVLLVMLGVAVAIYGGYSEHQDAESIASMNGRIGSLQQSENGLKGELRSSRAQLDALSKGQEFTRGQLDTIAKTLSNTPPLLKAAEHVPSVVLLPGSNQLNLFNRGDEDLKLVGDRLDDTPMSIEGPPRVISKGEFYYFLSDKLKQWALQTIGRDGERLVPFEVYISTMDNKHFIAKFYLLILMNGGAMTIHTQQLGVFRGGWSSKG